MSHLTIEKVNEVYLKITTEPHVERELKDRFTFEVPGAKVHAYNTEVSIGMDMYTYTI